MTLLVPAHYSPRKQDFLALLAGASSGAPTALTPNATASIKGSYTQIIASTAALAKWMDVFVQFNQTSAGSGQSTLVDIAVGGTGAEVIIVSNLVSDAIVQFGNSLGMFRLPVNIPAGSRISARCQNNVNSGNTVNVRVILYGPSNAQIVGGTGVETVGVSTVTTLGTVVIPATPGKGNYSTISGTIGNSWKGFVVGMDDQRTQGNFGVLAIDIAVGGSGAETVIVPDIYRLSQQFGAQGTAYGPFMVPVASGSRLSARASNNTSVPTPIGVSLYGIV